MFIADHAPVYPRVKLTRYDKLTALQQAAVFLHQDRGLDFQLAISSLLASAARDALQLDDRTALIHATDPDCTKPEVLVMTLRQPILWTIFKKPIDYLIVLRVPQLFNDSQLQQLRAKVAAVVAKNHQYFAQWRDDPVGLGMFADDLI
jgi:hypothetical protein